MSEFEELVDAHYQALYRFAMSLSRDSATACDLVQFLSMRRRSSKFSEEPLDEEAAGAVPSPQEDADRQLDGQRALELLAALDETYRAPVALFYLQQHSYKDIADILDVPIGTVMSRLSRGKELLRRKMMAEPSSAPKNILQLQDPPLRHHHG